MQNTAHIINIVLRAQDLCKEGTGHYLLKWIMGKVEGWGEKAYNCNWITKKNFFKKGKKI